MLINEGDKLLYKGDLVEVVRLLPALAWLGKEDGHTFQVNFIDLMQNSELAPVEEPDGIWIKRRDNAANNYDLEVDAIGDRVTVSMSWDHADGHSYAMDLTKEETRQVRDYLNDALESWEG